MKRRVRDTLNADVMKKWTFCKFEIITFVHTKGFTMLIQKMRIMTNILKATLLFSRNVLDLYYILYITM